MIKKSNKILVIGGSGFVGSSLINELVKKYDVENLDKNPSPFFNQITTIGNVINKNDLIFERSIHTVVLLAAEHKDNVSPTSLYYDVNVHGIKNVTRAMDKAGIKNIIFTSSVAIYGLNKPNPDEKFPQDPFNHYGKSKWEAELVLKKWFDNDKKNKSVTIIRPTVIFGERNRGNVYNLLKQIVSKRFIMIGQGENKKSMAYVGNTVAFIMHCLDNNKKGLDIYNYADKPDFTMIELVNLVENIMKIKLIKTKIPYVFGILGGYFFDIISLIFRKKFSISSVRVRKFCATTQFDSQKAHKQFKAPYTVSEGLIKTLDFEFKNSEKNDIVFYTE